MADNNEANNSIPEDEQTENTAITSVSDTENETPMGGNVTAHIEHVDTVNVFKTFFDYLPHMLIGLVGILALVVIYLFLDGKKDFGSNLSTFDQNSARALITVLVAIVTIAIAVILTLSAFFSQAKDFKERFTMGKEILTILIGVLGTIIGFYFGSANIENKSAAGQSMEILTPTPLISQINGKENIVFSTFIKGGEPPYTYQIYFYPNDAANSIEGKSDNGVIQENVEPTASMNENAIYHIRVVDKVKNSALLTNSVKNVFTPKKQNMSEGNQNTASQNEQTASETNNSANSAAR